MSPHALRAQAHFLTNPDILEAAMPSIIDTLHLAASNEPRIACPPYLDVAVRPLGKLMPKPCTAEADVMLARSILKAGDMAPDARAIDAGIYDSEPQIVNIVKGIRAGRESR